MPIHRLLQNVGFDPERIELVANAYEDTLREFQIADHDGPLAESIAKTIFETAQTGERNIERLRELTVAKLGLTMPSAPTAQKSGAPNARVSTVLIVEDDAIFAYAASRYFQSSGYKTVVADGSLAAFRELDRQPIDVVIADVQLNSGEPNGVSLGRMIRNRNRDLPVFLVTAHPDLVEREKPLPGPAFVKPVELAELSKAIAAALPR